MMTVSVGTITLYTLAACALALTFGVYYPQFGTENAAQIPTSFGGVVYMMASLSLLAVVIMIEAIPVTAYLRAAHQGLPPGGGITLALALGGAALLSDRRDADTAPDERHEDRADGDLVGPGGDRMIAVDLFSDTVTRPTPAMRRAMAEAEVGDEQLREDPTVNRLQDTVAELLGKEAALFLPSGTMCNQVAFAVHCRPGDEILLHEHGASDALRSRRRGRDAGAMFRATRRSPRHLLGGPGARGHPAAGALLPRSRVVWVEQTAQHGGRRVLAAGRGSKRSCGAAPGLGLACAPGRRPAVQRRGGHRRTPRAGFAAPFDSVWMDLTKGLGAPVGAVLAGSREFIAEAWRFKQRFGGAMRQAGIIAAGGTLRPASTTSSGSPTTTPAPAGWPAASRSCPASRWTRTGSRPTSSSST